MITYYSKRGLIRIKVDEGLRRRVFNRRTQKWKYTFTLLALMLYRGAEPHMSTNKDPMVVSSIYSSFLYLPSSLLSRMPYYLQPAFYGTKI